MIFRCILVGIGGFAGAVSRYLVSGWVQKRFGASFPYGTFVINVTGSFILGFFATLAVGFGWMDHWRLIFAVGFVGAYTTFSTFEYETLQLFTLGSPTYAVINLAGSIVVGFFAAYAGVVAARILTHSRI